MLDLLPELPPSVSVTRGESRSLFPDIWRPRIRGKRSYFRVTHRHIIFKASVKKLKKLEKLQGFCNISDYPCEAVYVKRFESSGTDEVTNLPWEVQIHSYICQKSRIAVKILDIWHVVDEDYNPYIHMVLEGLPMNLRMFLWKKRKLEVEEAIKLSKKLLQCIARLHTMGLIHRDIKPENILMTRNFRSMRLCDFELTTINNTSGGFTGTYPYTCHEALVSSSTNSSTNYTFSSDMWSVGVVLLELICGFIPMQCTGIVELEDVRSPLLQRDCQTITKTLKTHGLDEINPINWATLLDYLRGAADSNSANKSSKLVQLDTSAILTHPLFPVVKDLLCVDPKNRKTAKKCLVGNSIFHRQ